MFSVNDPGHNYNLHNVEEGVQEIQFIKKEPIPDSSSPLRTTFNGTTNEAVLQVLIDRVKFLDNKVPSEFNKKCLSHLEMALDALEQRTAERKGRKVEGTNAE